MSNIAREIGIVLVVLCAVYCNECAQTSDELDRGIIGMYMYISPEPGL